MIFRILLAVFLFVSVPAFADETGVIGTVIEVEGSASIGGRAAVPDLPVREGETLETRAGSRLMVLFVDDTQLTLGENTRVTSDAYVFNPDDASKNRAAWSIMNGAFLYVSGLIAKKPDPDVRITTPAGSIGVRGTQFWGGVLDGAYGVLVTEGRVLLTGRAGTTEIAQGLGSFVKDGVPGEPKAWAPEKTSRAVATVTLKRMDMVQKRLAIARAHQQSRQQRFQGVIERRDNQIERRTRVKPSQRRPVIKPTERNKQQ